MDYFKTRTSVQSLGLMWIIKTFEIIQLCNLLQKSAELVRTKKEKRCEKKVLETNKQGLHW